MVIIICPKCKSHEVYSECKGKSEYSAIYELSCGNCGKLWKIELLIDKGEIVEGGEE